ncbi:MAG: hypothetical protein HY465_03550 [Deltaproteobacteria bacterium]|nr:hypothetical protein [Deltaproteobacteria bacterium]
MLTAGEGTTLTVRQSDEGSNVGRYALGGLLTGMGLALDTGLVYGAASRDWSSYSLGNNLSVGATMGGAIGFVSLTTTAAGVMFFGDADKVTERQRRIWQVGVGTSLVSIGAGMATLPAKPGEEVSTGERAGVVAFGGVLATLGGLCIFSEGGLGPWLKHVSATSDGRSTGVSYSSSF